MRNAVCVCVFSEPLAPQLVINTFVPFPYSQKPHNSEASELFDVTFIDGPCKPVVCLQDGRVFAFSQQFDSWLAIDENAYSRSPAQCHYAPKPPSHKGKLSELLWRSRRPQGHFFAWRHLPEVAVSSEAAGDVKAEDVKAEGMEAGDVKAEDMKAEEAEDPGVVSRASFNSQAQASSWASTDLRAQLQHRVEVMALLGTAEEHDAAQRALACFSERYGDSLSSSEKKTKIDDEGAAEDGLGVAEADAPAADVDIAAPAEPAAATAEPAAAPEEPTDRHDLLQAEASPAVMDNAAPAEPTAASQAKAAPAEPPAAPAEPTAALGSDLSPAAVDITAPAEPTLAAAEAGAAPVEPAAAELSTNSDRAAEAGPTVQEEKQEGLTDV